MSGFTLRALAGFALLMVLATAAQAAASLPEVERCRQDLASRLQVDVASVKTVRVAAATFSDTSLGLPRPGMFYAQVLTPGWRVVLDVEGMGEYGYAASGNTMRYAGPLSAWVYSALYVEPVANDPNLNGNLVQISLAGTNPEVVAREVENVMPQPDGAVLATRRTSRSAHALLYMGGERKMTTVASAFDFGDAAIDPEKTKWAAFTRFGVGQPWELAMGALQGGKVERCPLPAGKPHRVYWTGSAPTVVMLDQTSYKAYERTAEWKPQPGFRAPDALDYLLNKSEHLAVEDVLKGSPAVAVLRVWFNGDEKVVATIPGISLIEWVVTPLQSYVLVCGRKDDLTEAYAVGVHTGEVLPIVSAVRSPVRLLACPPRAALDWIR